MVSINHQRNATMRHYLQEWVSQEKEKDANCEEGILAQCWQECKLLVTVENTMEIPQKTKRQNHFKSQAWYRAPATDI